DTSGKTLLGSTYLGGERVEGGSSVGGSFTYFNPQNSVGELIMDEFNNCYVIGSSNSINYPVTPGCFKVHSDSNGFSDIVISKLNSNLTSLVWSTFYGGRRANVPVGIKLSKSGKLYCAGTTTSLDFYTTPGVIASTSVTTMDMVVFSLDIASGFPLASTYMGARNSQALRIDIDLNDNVYLIGGTTAPNSFTPTPGAYNINTGNFLFYKTNPNLSQVNVLAKFGYPVSFTGKIEFDAFNVDSCGYVYFGGFAQGGLPVTPDAFKPVGNGDGNIYLGVFNPNFTGLKFATYYGGDTGPANLNFYHDHDDGGLNYFDDRGYFYHANCVNNNFPITTNAYSAYNVKDSLVYPSSVVRNSDAFIKIDLQTFVNANSSLGGLIRSCSPITTTFVANANLGSVTIIPGDGSPSVNTNSLVYTYSVFGTYNAFVVAGSDSSTCNITDSVKIIFKYGPPPFEPLSDTTINCSGKKVILNAGNEGSIYSWNTGQTTQTITPQQSGWYEVYIDNGYCSRTDSTFVLVTQEQDFTLPNAFSPNGDGINDNFCLQGWDFCNESFLIMIFDRWGEKVFQSDNPKFCWNGIYKGQVLSADVYIYTISAKYADDVIINKRGNITLIK
ncbi:MAG: gliding motility-associated C-terminal domain-containing protein, partial [Bacteroidia bacterium]|nr:gliding motility-associated C-terminal domain-containing protein [Bacteroidia bacterium]